MTRTHAMTFNRNADSLLSTFRSRRSITSVSAPGVRRAIALDREMAAREPLLRRRRFESRSSRDRSVSFDRHLPCPSLERTARARLRVHFGHRSVRYLPITRLTSPAHVPIALNKYSTWGVKDTVQLARRRPYKRHRMHGDVRADNRLKQSEIPSTGSRELWCCSGPAERSARSAPDVFESSPDFTRVCWQSGCHAGVRPAYG